MEKDFNVELIGVTEDAELLSVAGALGCFEEKSSAQILEELKALPPDERNKKVKAVLENSFGRGHGSIGDQNLFVFSIENLPRLAIFQLCLPEYLAHLQQSLRRAKADRGFHVSEAIKESKFRSEVEDTLSGAFELYEEMCKAEIPGEDARFILPLATRTNIQTAGNARELSHLWKMSQGKYVPSIVKAVVDEMITKAKEIAPYLFEEMGYNYETLAWYPSAQLYYEDSNIFVESVIRKLIEKTKMFYGEKAKEVKLISPSEITGLFRENGINTVVEVVKLRPSSEIIGLFTEDVLKKAVEKRKEEDLAALKHIHFEFLVPMSLACLHQAIRQRTWNHCIESIYNAVDRGSYVAPPSIKNNKDFEKKFLSQQRKMFDLQYKLRGLPFSETIGVIPHSLLICTWVHVNGWNAIHSIGKRTCLTAQWEIRKIAKEMAKQIEEVMPALGKWAKPQCITYGSCPERESCGYQGGKEE